LEELKCACGVLGKALDEQEFIYGIYLDSECGRYLIFSHFCH
jgi:hypothetical protein